MGKHDKANFEWQKPEIKVINYDPPNDDFYKARISTLERENLELRERVSDLEKALGNMDLVIEHGENVSNGINNELREIIAEKEAEIETLEKALLNAVTRLGWECQA